MHDYTNTSIRNSWRQAWPMGWDRLHMPTSEKEAEALAKACGRRFSTMTAQIRALIDQGAIHQAKKLRRRIFRSDSAKIFAMERANLKKGIKSAKLPMIADALSLRMDQRPDETVWLDRREKKDGTFRPIYSFGPLEYARQWLALQVANIFAPVSNRQFMHSGGVKSAADWLEANIKSRTVVTTTDIPDAFGVQNRVHLENDGLLPKVVMKSVLYDTMADAKVPKSWLDQGEDFLSPSIFSDYGTGPAPGRGLPPGSAPASLLTDVRLSRLLLAVEAKCEGAMIGAYLDNIVILTPTKKMARATMEALLDAVLSEYGPKVASIVRSREKTTYAGDGFFFLGDHYQRKGGKMIRRVADGTFDSYAAKLAQDVQLLHLSPKQVADRINGWAQSRAYDPSSAALAQTLRDEFHVTHDGQVAEKKALTGDTSGYEKDASIVQI